MSSYDMYAVHEFLQDDDYKTPKSSGLVRILTESAKDTCFVKDDRIWKYALWETVFYACMDATTRFRPLQKRPHEFIIEGKSIFQRMRDELCEDSSFAGRLNEWFAKSPEDMSQASYDAWHEECCDLALKAYSSYFYITWQDMDRIGLEPDPGEVRPERLRQYACYGRAQLLVNMTMMYLYCFAAYMDTECRYVHCFRYCHMPADGVIMMWAERFMSVPGKSWTLWSRPEYTAVAASICDFFRSGRHAMPACTEELKQRYEQKINTTGPWDEVSGASLLDPSKAQWEEIAPLEAAFYIWPIYVPVPDDPA